jgi:hypothetical protein
LFNWVAYPITTLISGIYGHEMGAMRLKKPASALRLELLASLERVLCFCHTGNTAVFATSLMNGLGLSRGALKDGFPMLHRIFEEGTVSSAMNHGFKIDARQWPMKDGHPAVASKRTQVLTYSLAHFMVRDLVEHARRGTFLSSASNDSIGCRVWEHS